MVDISWAAQGAGNKEDGNNRDPSMEQLPGHVSPLTHRLARKGPGCQDQAGQEQHLQDQAESPGRNSISRNSSIVADGDRRQERVCYNHKLQLTENSRGSLK